MEFKISDVATTYSRYSYNLLELIGDLGGVSDIFAGVLAIFVGPIVEMSFLLKALENLYLAKSSDVRFVNNKSKSKKY